MSTALAPGKKKRGVGGIVVAVAGLVGFAAFLGVRVKETLADREAMADVGGGAAKGPEPSRIVRGAAATFRPVVPVTGTLAAVQETDLAFKLGGRLASVLVKEGDVVAKGAAIASLDCAEMNAQVAAAQAAIRAASAQVALASDAESRTRALHETLVVGDADLVGSRLRVELARAELARANAGASLAAATASGCSLRAPFGGLVTRAPAGIGKIVGPGEPLFHLQDTSVLELRATVSEVDRHLVEIGASVEVTPDRGDVGFAVSAGHGTVSAVLATLDAKTRRVPVVAQIPASAGSALLAGAFVRARIHSAREVSVLELPATALRPGSQDEIVIVKDGKAQRRRVVFTLGDAGVLRVREGLATTDDVVVAPSGETQDGDPVVVAAN